MEKDHSAPEPAPTDKAESASDSKKDAKKSAKKIGGFLVDKKPSEATEKSGKDTSKTGKSNKPAAETAPASGEASHAPLESLSQGEQQYVTEALVRAKQEHTAAQPEATQYGPQTEAAHIASEAAVSSFHDKILEGQNVEAAFADTMAELREPAPDTTEQVTETSSELLDTDEAQVESEAEPELAEDEAATPQHEAGPTIEQAERVRVETEHATEPEPTPAVVTPAPAVPASVSTTTPRTSSVLGARATPIGAGSYNLNSIAAGPGIGASLGAEYVPARDESFLAPIAGGIVGYLIGRRRGRIKSEKKLLPIQKKLEQQVTNLQENLAAKDQAIRKATHTRKSPPAALSQPKIEQAKERPVTSSSELERQSAPAERRVVAPEAQQLHAKTPTREHIGHMLVGAEAVTAITAGAVMAVDLKTERQPIASTERIDTRQIVGAESVQESLYTSVEARDSVEKKSVETLSRSELMNLSDGIIIEGTSLRQIYETQLVGERGLRRLVAEHLRGGDLQKALRQEITEREIDFERDPVMRDLPAVGVAAGGVTHSEAFHGMLEKAGAAIGDNDEEVAFLKARAEHQDKQLAKHKQQRKVIDVSLAVVIAVLTAFIVTLFITG